MTTYASVSTRTKKELKERIAKGERIVLLNLTPFGTQTMGDGEYHGVCGPHYPAPHSWYGTAVVKGGQIVKVK